MSDAADISTQAERKRAKDYRIDEETLFAMGSIYCRKHHPAATRSCQGVCEECARVVEYSLARTQACPHEHQGTCKTCTIHCYKPEMRAAIRAIMRYGAPRMTYQHPVLTAHYLAKKIRERRTSAD